MPVSLMDWSELEGTRAGINIDANGGSDWNYLYQVLDWWQPRSHLVMSNIYKAYEIADRYPNSITSARLYHPDDTKYWLMHHPEEAFAYMVAHGARPHDRVGFEINCEPQTGSRLRDLLNWEIRLARICRDHQIHYFTAFATGKTINKADVDAGIWDEFIHELHTNPFFHLGIHGYAYIRPAAGYIPNFPANLLDGQAMHYSNWPTYIEHNRVNGNLPDNWHLWREDWLQIRSKELGYGAIPYMWTEGIHDNMDDVAHKVVPGTGGLSLKEFFKSKSPFNDVRGVRSCFGPWQYMYRDVADMRNMGPEDIAAMDFVWVEGHTPPECAAINFFQWTRNKDWETFWTQELRRMHQLLRLLPTRKGISFMTEDTRGQIVYPNAPNADDPNWGKTPITVSPIPSNTYFNLRSKPVVINGPDGTFLKRIEGAFLAFKHKTAKWPEDGQSADHEWIALKFMDGTRGWAATDVIVENGNGEDTKVPEPPTEEPPVEEPPTEEPTPIPPEVEEPPAEIRMTLPVTFAAEQRKLLSQLFLLIGHLAFAMSYALVGKIYNPKVLDDGVYAEWGPITDTGEGNPDQREA